MSQYNLIDDIPQYRKVEIINRSGNIVGKHPLILDEDFSIKLSSKYGQLWEGSSSTLATLMSSANVIPSGQFALQGAQIWQSTDPISLSFSVRLEMDSDPYNDVVIPVLLLSQQILPSVADGYGSSVLSSAEELIESTFNIKLKTLIPPGPDYKSLITMMSDDIDEDSKSYYLMGSNTSKGLCRVKIGFALFDYMVITSAEPSFSKEVALSATKNKYYPVSASVQLELISMEVATTDMMNHAFKS